ncbi:hypothetical protein [Nocardiopsis dassonvillei]|uniref:hypothetical protein n=1 Tax=Nocardiopsis dassonvillei TaxID=2014 RepID=UPI0036374372
MTAEPDDAAYRAGGVLPASPKRCRLGPDEHVLQPFGGQLHCVRPDHRRHVCHGNQYDPNTLMWRQR